MRSETNSHAASAGPVVLSSADENSTSPENDSELAVDFAASPPDADTLTSPTTSALVNASRYIALILPDGEYRIHIVILLTIHMTDHDCIRNRPGWRLPRS